MPRMGSPSDPASSELKQAVIVGGCGFLGQSLASMIVKKGGYNVTLCDIAPCSNEELMKSVKYVKGDINNEAELIAAFSGADVVFHVASPHPEKLDRVLFQKVNVDGTKTVISACKKAGVSALVYTSSASVVYSGKDIVCGTEDLPYVSNQPDVYMQSKAEAEKLILEANCKELSTAAIRPHSIFGRNDKALMKGLFDAGRAGKLRFMIGDGANIVDFTHVDNVSWAHLLAADKLLQGAKGVAGEAFFVTNDEPIRFWAFASKFCGEMGFQRPMYQLPYWLMLIVGAICEMIIGDGATFSTKRVKLVGTHHWFSCEKAKKLLGYSPIITVEQGLIDACTELKEMHGIKVTKDKHAQPSFSNTQFGAWFLFIAHLLLFSSSMIIALSLLLSTLVSYKITTPQALGIMWAAPSLIRAHMTGTCPLTMATLAAVASLATTAIGIIKDASSVPMIKTYPILGAFPQFAGGPVTFVQKMSRECRDMFCMSLAGIRVYYASGPSALEMVFKATDEELSQAEVYRMTRPLFGSGVIYDAPSLDIRAQQFHFLTTGLSEKHMIRYVDSMVQECEQYFATHWGDKGEVDINVALAELIILTASRSLMGKEVREHLFEKVADLYHKLEEGITYISAIWPDMPLPKHWQRDDARKKLKAIFSKVIQGRRAAAAAAPKAAQEKGSDYVEHDILEILMNSQYKDGRYLTDDEMCGMLICLLFAGQHTSSITSAWLVINMLVNADRVMPRVVEEQEAAGDLNYDTITKKLDFLGACMTESLRMYPPLVFVMRYAKVSKVWKGQVIPAGSIVAASPAETGMNPDIYEKPDYYNPDRWTENSWEDWRKDYKYIGFGAGRHTCMGRRFATLQIRTIVSVMVRMFKLKAVSPLPEIDEKQMVVGPKGAFMVQYERIFNSKDGCASKAGASKGLKGKWGI